MAFNTGNPIGSTDSRDRLDNSENLDYAVNSTELKFTDRLGRSRDTLEGIGAKFGGLCGGNFTNGFTVENRGQYFYYENGDSVFAYQWVGSPLALTVAAGTAPSDYGVIGADWIDKTDVALRSELKIVSIIPYLTTSISTSDAITNAATIAGEGGAVRFPSGTYTITPGVSIPPVRMLGDGQGSTIFNIDNTVSNVSAFITSAPTKQNVEFGAEHITFRAINGNGLYLFDNPRGAELNSLRPKVTYKHISICGTDTTSSSDNFAQDHGWRFVFHLGDSWCLTMDGIDHCGVYLPSIDPSTQPLLDGFIRSNPSAGILSGRIRNITTHNVANFFELVKKTYVSFESVDVALAYRGIYDADDRAFEDKVYNYGESVWTNVIINAQKSCVNLKNRFALICNGLILHRSGSGYDSADKWIALNLERAICTSISGLEISSSSAFTASQCGIVFDGGSANTISGLKVGTLDTCLSLGVASSSNGAAQSVNITNVQLSANVGLVIDAQNARNVKFSGFSKSSAYTYDTFVAFTDTATKNSCDFFDCPTDWTIRGNGTGLIINEGATTDQKIWKLDNSSGLTLATRTDDNGGGENAFVFTRSGTTVTKAELRANTTSGYVLLTGNSIQVSGTLKPTSDNTISNGNASFRWSTIYAGTGAINTSDAREKTDPLPIDDAVLDAWGDVCLITFRWLQSIQEKGEDSARWHFGVIAQQVRDAFIAHGLDGTKYGLLCYDEWEAEQEITNEDGSVIHPAVEAGHRWGIRPDQCLFLEAAYLRRRCERIEARLLALESQ